MDEMKQRLYDTVDARLAAAPDSTAKTELVEELSDNLYHRYLDMTASGAEPEDAYQKALDELGDTGELVDYLKSLAPDEPLPKLVLRPEQGAGSQLDDLFRDVEAIVSGAFERAKSAVMEAKEHLKENSTFDWKSDNGSVEVHIAKDPPDEGGENAEPEQESEAAGKSRGWEFSVGYDTDEGRFFAGGGPKEKDTVYGFGYDKAKGGFYTQWGKENAEAPSGDTAPGDGPVSSDALRGIEILVDGDVTIRMTEDPEGDVVIDGDVDDLEVRRSDDGVLTIRQGKTASSSFFFLRGLSSADVELALPVRDWDFLSISSASGDVQISGDGEVGLLSVNTISGNLDSQLARCRRLVFKSTSGDLNWDGDVGEAQAETISGDITFAAGHLPCAKLLCKSTSGDVNVRGAVDQLTAQTTSGDIMSDGQIGSVRASSMSGEVELSGSVSAAHCSSMSGDVRLESAVLPEQMELSSKSGDCEARIPDGGPFTIHFKTTSGSYHSDFFDVRGGDRGGDFAHQGGGPVYRLTSISGDLYLRKY